MTFLSGLIFQVQYETAVFTNEEVPCVFEAPFDIDKTPDKLLG